MNAQDNKGGKNKPRSPAARSGAPRSGTPPRSGSPRPAAKPRNRPADEAPKPIRRPNRLPLLEAICKKMNQRINLEDDQSVLALYERGWILKGVLCNLEGDEERFVKALATRHNSWIARQVA